MSLVWDIYRPLLLPLILAVKRSQALFGGKLFSVLPDLQFEAFGMQMSSTKRPRDGRPS